MSLQFQAPFQIQPDAETPSQKSLRNFTKTVGDIGDEALKFRQQNIENQRQAQLMKFQQAQDARQSAATRYEYGYDPAAGEQPPSFDMQGPQPSGSLQQGTTGPQLNTGMDSDTGQPMSMPIDHTSHFMNWKSQGMPMTYDHPDYGGTGQGMGQPQNPMMGQPQSGQDLFSTMSRIPGAKNQELFLKSQDEVRKQREEADKYGTGGANSLYSTYDQAAFQLAPGDPQKQAQLRDQLQTLYPNGRVPKTAISTTAGGIRLDVTQGEHASQFADKRLTALGDALDPSKQRAGAFGVSKQVFDRAERLESLANAYKDGNLDSRQIEEMAIGLNAMLSGANTGASEQVKSLVPQTIWGNAQKLKEWFLNNPQGMQQQAFVQRMLGSVSREKQTASDQIKRTQFQRIGRYADLENSNPDGFYNVLQSAGIEPDEYKQWKKGGYKPMTAVQSPENGAGGGGWSYVGPVTH